MPTIVHDDGAYSKMRLASPYGCDYLVIVRCNITARHEKEYAMKSTQINQVIDSMNVMDRARAVRGMHQAMVLGNMVDAITSSVRGALGSAGRAMTLVYGRPSR